MFNNNYYRKTELELTGDPGEFEIELSLFPTDEYDTEFAGTESMPPAVEVPDIIYLQISIEGDHETLTILVKYLFVQDIALP